MVFAGEEVEGVTINWKRQPTVGRGKSPEKFDFTVNCGSVVWGHRLQYRLKHWHGGARETDDI